MENKPKDLDFQVRYPQLESLPGDTRMGLKRYNIHKNDSSKELFFNAYKFINKDISSLPSVTSSSSRRHKSSFDKYKAYSDKKSEDIFTLKQELKIKENELSQYKNMIRSNRAFKSVEPESKYPASRKLDADLYGLKKNNSNGNPISSSHQNLFRNAIRSKYIPTDRNSNPFLEYLNHPAFKQPHFTKQNPKIIFNDPITGLQKPPAQSLSPDKIRQASFSPEKRYGINDNSYLYAESRDARKLNHSFV